MNAPQQPWLDAGYRTFAYEGPTGLKVERLARAVGKNKSSFYHHFADLEVFTNLLLDQHLAQARIMAEKEANCPSLEALVDILLDHATDLLFSRQLRIHREVPEFAACFERVNQVSVPAILPLWSQLLELTDNSYLARLVLQLSLENFFIQLTDETLNRDWLMAYFGNLQSMVREFRRVGELPLDASV